MSKDEKGKKDKKGGKDEKAKAQDVMSLGSHPVAGAHIRTAKGIGGLFGLLAVAWLTWSTGAALPTIGLRALVGGMVGYVIAWSLMLTVWRYIAVADINAKRKEAEEAYRAYLEEQDALDDAGDLAAPAA